MTPRLRLTALASATFLSAATCITTIVEPQWFERLFDSAPDAGDGSLETIVSVAASAVACAVFALLTRREWRRRQAASLATSSTARR